MNCMIIYTKDNLCEVFMAITDRSCFFSGHRVIASSLLPAIGHRIESACETLFNEHGVTDFIAGGALGFDTLAALTVLRIREQYKDIRLRLFLPCTDQAKRWNSHDKAVWKEILKSADEYKYITDGSYLPGCMQLRNRAMADAAAHGIVYCTKKSGGTFYTVNYALDKGKHIIFL